MKKLNSLLILLLIGSIVFITKLNAISSSESVKLSVEIKEFLLLEIFTPSQTLTNCGQSSAQVTTNFNIDDNPVNIRVILSVPRNQEVQLRVQTYGDLINSQGETFPISNVAWQASGAGFNDGILSKDSPQIMASWTGQGFYQGTINYFYVKSPSSPGDYTQTITYNLVIP